MHRLSILALISRQVRQNRVSATPAVVLRHMAATGDPVRCWRLRHNGRLACIVILAMFLAPLIPYAAAGADTVPPQGIRDHTPKVFALTGAQVVISSDHSAEQATLLIRDGLIAGVGRDIDVPGDAVVIDLAGKTIYPGLIDAFSSIDVPHDSQTGTAYWNPHVHPQLDVARSWDGDPANQREQLRGQGITLRLVVPGHGIIKGRSALVTTADVSRNLAVVQSQVAQHLHLTIGRGRDRNAYPNSPMGAVALARQALYDAQWYGQAWRAYQSNRNLPRPEQNRALEVLLEDMSQPRLFIVEAADEQYFLRADRFAREFGIPIAVRGSGDEYRRLKAVASSGRHVILPVNFPKPPEVDSIAAATNVSLERLIHWHVAPENPSRLVDAGVRISFTADGLDDVNNFLAGVRTAVSRGLSPQAALHALTSSTAELLGVAARVGTLEADKLAHLLVTDGDLFAKDTKVLETWIDGQRYKIVTPPALDLRGHWELQIHRDSNVVSARIELTGEPDKLSGTIVFGDGEQNKETLNRPALDQNQFGCTFKSDPLKAAGQARLAASVVSREGSVSWLGSIVWPDGNRSSFSAERTAAPDETSTARGEDDSAPNNREDEHSESVASADESSAAAASAADSVPILYPLGAFGRGEPPPQPELIALTGATIWTASDAGVVEQGTILVGRGKIISVGSDVPIPDEATVVDISGSHISPGIIDCHSHMATDGGVNEGTQAITSEVRIGDFIDAADINIYRQLAGGVTSSNILHGSANPIGGQNQVIKLRWGALPEEMKFHEAPSGIKFALGENVKQSNWGDQHTTRYPQTRMGVEQIMRDAFNAARAYQRKRELWGRGKRMLPPRRDLELEAILEILQHRRWIHCHSYRQDEILALLRTLESFDIRIGTFQHILEGYKVAEAMSKHGAMGSAFSDWWAYKFEVYDAIPYNGALMHDMGIVVSFNSDDRELARHLNHEAAKAVKYGGVDPLEALKFVTLNPAKQLRIEQYVGSLEPGKHADFVVWSGPPLSNFSRCQQTWVDGRKYFDRTEDAQLRERDRKLRAMLVQKVMSSGEPTVKPEDEKPRFRDLWPRYDEFCHLHQHEDGE